jgi:hypothetical protein
VTMKNGGTVNPAADMRARLCALAPTSDSLVGVDAPGMRISGSIGSEGNEVGCRERQCPGKCTPSPTCFASVRPGGSSRGDYARAPALSRGIPDCMRRGGRYLCHPPYEVTSPRGPSSDRCLTRAACIGRVGPANPPTLPTALDCLGPHRWMRTLSRGRTV